MLWIILSRKDWHCRMIDISKLHGPALGKITRAFNLQNKELGEFITFYIKAKGHRPEQITVPIDMLDIYMAKTGGSNIYQGVRLVAK